MNAKEILAHDSTCTPMTEQWKVMKDVMCLYILWPKLMAMACGTLWLPGKSADNNLLSVCLYLNKTLPSSILHRCEKVADRSFCEHANTTSSNAWFHDLRPFILLTLKVLLSGKCEHRAYCSASHKTIQATHKAVFHLAFSTWPVQMTHAKKLNHMLPQSTSSYRMKSLHTQPFYYIYYTLTACQVTG